MRYASLLSCCLILLAAVPAAGQRPADLTAPHTVSAGDHAALLLTEAFKLGREAGELRTTPVIMFNPVNMKVVDIHLIESDADMTVARGKIESVVQWLERAAIPLLERHMNIKTTNANFRVYYLVRKDAGPPEVVIAWHDGKYMTLGR